MGEAKRRVAKIKRLIERLDRGEVISPREAINLCPFGSLIARPDVAVSPTSRPDVALVMLSFEVEELSPQQRQEAVEAIERGEVVLIAANLREQWTHAKRELELALMPPAGVA
jgi:hypothetical protein